MEVWINLGYKKKKWKPIYFVIMKKKGFYWWIGRIISWWRNLFELWRIRKFIGTNFDWFIERNKTNFNFICKNKNLFNWIALYNLNRKKILNHFGMPFIDY
jgi:hypothetical protein